jgi:sulfate transport system substrate-binding protein
MAALCGLTCCRKSGGEGHPITLTVAGYTTVREVVGRELLPSFAKHVMDMDGREIRFQESYQGSGAQSRAIAAGFQADVAVLSMAPDVQRLVDAGLVPADWGAGEARGMVSRSAVVIAVRPGNPRGIGGWEDLGRPGVEVLTPDPRTSGGAMWNIAAIVAAARQRPEGPSDRELLVKILRNVRVMDRGARESLLTFERGVGDAAITYEHEVVTANLEVRRLDMVRPRPTMLIEHPAVVVQAHARQHGVEDLALRLVEFLRGGPAQSVYARYGYRSYQGPPEEGLISIDALGGWPRVTAELFGPGGLYEQALREAQGS